MKKQIEITKEQAVELLKTTPAFTDIIYENFPELKPKKRWFDEYKCGSYRIINNNNTGIFETGNLFVKLEYKDTLIFKTKEQASQHAKRLNLYTEMQVFANFRNGDWVADWNDKAQCKYCISLEGSKIFIFSNYTYMHCIFPIAVKNKEIAEEMLDEFVDRIKECFNLN